MGDDVGWFNIGAYHEGIMSGKTPNLDKLASQGMRFTDYYAGRAAPPAFVLVQQRVAELAKTAIEYPPIQAPASFNLDAAKAQVEEAIKNHAGQ